MTNAPIALADAEGDTRWVKARPLVVFFATTPDPDGQVAYRVHVMAQALDGSEPRVVTPHNAGWAQLAPGGARLASISFPERALIVTDLESGEARTIVPNVMPRRSATLETDLPPTLQWSPDGKAILVQSPEDDQDGDGELDRATMRLYDAATGAVRTQFFRPEMGPYLFTRDGTAVAVPSLRHERSAVLVDLASHTETEAALAASPTERGFAVGELHVNQTPSLVLHDTAIGGDDAILTARGPDLVLAGRGPERTVVTAKTAIHAPAWAPDGRHAVFEAGGSLYVYDAAEHRLGLLGRGAPSPLVVDPAYRPPARRLRPPGSAFDLAFRTY